MDVKNIILALSTIVIGSLIIKLSSKYFNKIKETKAFNELIKRSSYSEAITWYFTYFIKVTCYIITCLIAISFLGFAPQVLGLIAVIMAFSIIGVLTYSLRDVIPSIIAGTYLLNSKVIKKGDLINIKGYKGRVQSINLIAITVKDWKGSVIIIPNKIVLEKIIKKN
jgi:small-conductance mechanosensitive channel